MARLVPSPALGFAFLALTWLHVLRIVPLPLVDAMDRAAVDWHIRWAMPGTRDARVVIIDIDEASLAAVGRWPWRYSELGRLVQTLFEQQGVATVAFDMVFAEPPVGDERAEAVHASGANEQGANQRPIMAQSAGPPRAAASIRNAERALIDGPSRRKESAHDFSLGHMLAGRPVVLGYYFTSDRAGYRHGVLPPPLFNLEAVAASGLQLTQWDGYGANHAALAHFAPTAGFFNAVTDEDGLVRRLPILAAHDGGVYGSLALATVRLADGQPSVLLRRSPARLAPPQTSLFLPATNAHPAPGLSIPLARDGTAYIAFRGTADDDSAPFTFVSAHRLLQGEIPPQTLAGAIALIGSTAPGLMDTRSTPVGRVMPGVEIHAHMISAMLDGRVLTRPDWAPALELLLVTLTGVWLTATRPRKGVGHTAWWFAAPTIVLVALDVLLFLRSHWLIPVATSAALSIGLGVALTGQNLVRERLARQRLTQLFGIYVPKERVAEMVRRGLTRAMAAETREMTVLFCDLRGFTRLAEHLPPNEIQRLLNQVFDRLTEVIQRHDGTIDKYIGDAIMAFWGAPLVDPAHATHAVAAALDMSEAIAQLNAERAVGGEPPIGIGIGINTGPMCVGDMGSRFRRSYTVIGDAVNIAARLETLTRTHGVDIIASATTRAAAPQFRWTFLGEAALKGRDGSVPIYHPHRPSPGLGCRA